MRRIVAVAAIALLSASFAAAQETTGSIVGIVTSEDGLALPGVVVEVVNPVTGLLRTATSEGSGRFRFPDLQPARYTVAARLDGFQGYRAEVAVLLGETARHDFEMVLGTFADVLDVTDEMALLDPTSTVAGMTVDTDDLSLQIPLGRDVTQVSLLAPGTLPGDASYEGNTGPRSEGYTPGQSLVAIGGSSVAENSYLVNGLNVSSVSTLMGSSFVPMEFVEQAQVKTGGYEAEFGRSTGGVVNLVTKSGTNSLRGSFSTYWSPEALQEQRPDTYGWTPQGEEYVQSHRQDEERRSLEVNASLGGKLIEDRLFFFGFVRWLDASASTVGEVRARQIDSSDPYWGGKLDWQIGSSHRLEGTYFSDRVALDTYFYWFDPTTRAVGEFIDHGVRHRGGDNAILRYSGLLSENLLISAQAGLNEFANSGQSDRADVCPAAFDVRTGRFQVVGCWIDRFLLRYSDRRSAYRGDIDWFVGRHALRAGADLEPNQTTAEGGFSGGVEYQYWYNWGFFDDLPPDQQLVNIHHQVAEGTFDAMSNAAYLQDSWAVAPGLTLNLGIRWEQYDLTNADGESILDISDQFAPRLGVAWDPRGDGRDKLYGSYGVYHLPMTTYSSMLIGRRIYQDVGWYLFDGVVNPDGTPGSVGEELKFDVFVDWKVGDVRRQADTAIEPMSQREWVLGYQRLFGDQWSLGLRGVVREFQQVIEDLSLDKALYEVYEIERCYAMGCAAYVLTNPGTDFEGWFDLDRDGELDPISLTAEQLEYPPAERQYRALELNVERRFNGRWMLNGSYVWSRSQGNYEGLVNSDFGQVAPYLTQTADIAGLLEHAVGDLPNDRRHAFKLFGTYVWPTGLRAGGFFWYRTGRPINGFGFHPTDPWAQVYSDSSFYNDGEPCPRGCGGRTDATWALDLTLGYDFAALGADWRLHVDAFNVFNNDTVTELDEVAEWKLRQRDPVTQNPDYLLPRHHQRPRSIRFGFGVQF